MRRLLALALGLVAAMTIVAVLNALLTHDPLPQQTDGLPIRTVSEAIALREGLDETSPIAVRGWYSTGVPHSCPAPMGPDGRIRAPTPLELYCRRGEIVLTELPEAGVDVHIERGLDTMSTSFTIRHLAGPHLDPVVFAPVSDLPITPPGIDPWVPQPIIAVGHFADHRAADCPPAERGFCRSAFVIDHLPAVRGEQQGPVRQPIPGLGPAVRTPQDVEDRVRQELGQDATVLSTSAYRGSDLPSIEDRAPRIPDREAVWLVITIDRGADGSAKPRLVSLVVDDASLALRWSSEGD
jgi:hypothetical protein